MMTLRQLILTASNQPEGSTLSTHLHNLQAIKYIPILETLKITEESKVLSIESAAPITLKITTPPADSLSILREENNLNIGANSSGFKVSQC